jgi:hypothetical protein
MYDTLRVAIPSLLLFILLFMTIALFNHPILLVKLERLLRQHFVSPMNLIGSSACLVVKYEFLLPTDCGSGQNRFASTLSYSQPLFSKKACTRAFHESRTDDKKVGIRK